MKILLFLIVLGSLGAAHGQDLLDYKNKQYHFTLQYPSNWEKMEPHTSIFVLSERDVKEWTEKSSFDIEVNDTLKDLNQFCSTYANSMRISENFKQFKIISRKDTTFKNFPAIELTCTAFIPQNKKTVQWRSMFFIKGDKVFKLTLSSYPEKFATASDATKVIYESFRFQ
ncbi:MAG TPA: PsbP-related protein [Candidatus Kapabacteria bacterium]|nr:PsbP-related protein [Candidatus Kapabacteria bacterium]